MKQFPAISVTIKRHDGSNLKNCIILLVTIVTHLFDGTHYQKSSNELSLLQNSDMFNEVIDETTWDERNGIPIIEEKLLVFKEKRDELYSNVINYKHLKLSSDAFVNHGILPSKYTCDGKNINPAINIGNLPENAKSLAVVVDAPNHVNGNCCHWVIWNLPITDCIEEGEHRGMPGRNDFGFYKYNGPCPTTGTHRYLFKVYALDCVLTIPACSDKIQLEKAMKHHVVGFGFLVGKYHMRF